MFTVIIPTYKNPQYLDLCLKSVLENSILDSTRVIVVVDGFGEQSAEVLARYKNHSKLSVLQFPENRGMAYAINVGVYKASTKYVFIVNDDNVFPFEWDSRLDNSIAEMAIDDSVLPTGITVNQIEPVPSIFDFVIKDFGRDAQSFQYEEFLKFENSIITERAFDNNGLLFPFVITKETFMACGGFDLYYTSPFWVDVDFWTKLELMSVGPYRTLSLHLYHFGSAATKKGTDGASFLRSESVAAQQYKYKWGHLPDIVANVKHGNTKLWGKFIR